MNERLSKQTCDKMTFCLFCIAIILLPTQIIFGGVSWAISDFMIPFLGICFFRYNKDIRFNKGFIIFFSSIFLQLFFSLSFIFRNPSYAKYISDSFLSIIKISVCLLYAMLFYVFFQIINRDQYLKYLKIMNCIGTVEGILCFIGPILYYMGKSTSLVKYGYRANGTFDDPNLVGVFLLLCIGLSISRLSFVTTYKKNIPIYISIIVMSGGIIMTASKAAIFSLLFSFFSIFIIAIIKRFPIASHLFKLFCFSIVAIIIISISTNFFDSIFGRFSSSNNVSELTTGRSKLWLSALKMSFSNFNLLHGVGIGMYENLLEEYGVHSHIRAHNTYLSLLSECGIVMFLQLSFYLIWCFHRVLKKIIKHYSYCALGILFSVIGIMIEFFALNLQNSRTTYIFLLFVYFYINTFFSFETELNDNESCNHVC